MVPKSCAAPAARLAAEARPELSATTLLESSMSKAANARAMASSTSSPEEPAAGAATEDGGRAAAAGMGVVTEGGEAG